MKIVDELDSPQEEEELEPVTEECPIEVREKNRIEKSIFMDGGVELLIEADKADNGSIYTIGRLLWKDGKIIRGESDYINLQVEEFNNLKRLINSF